MSKEKIEPMFPGQQILGEWKDSLDGTEAFRKAQEDMKRLSSVLNLGRIDASLKENDKP